jgi:hypothetical protein
LKDLSNLPPMSKITAGSAQARGQGEGKGGKARTGQELSSRESPWEKGAGTGVAQTFANLA